MEGMVEVKLADAKDTAVRSVTEVGEAVKADTRVATTAGEENPAEAAERAVERVEPARLAALVEVRPVDITGMVPAAARMATADATVVVMGQAGGAVMKEAAEVGEVVAWEEAVVVRLEEQAERVVMETAVEEVEAAAETSPRMKLNWDRPTQRRGSSYPPSRGS